MDIQYSAEGGEINRKRVGMELGNVAKTQTCNARMSTKAHEHVL